MSSQPFRATVRTILRDRLLDAAAASFADDGWRRMTMSKVADRAGVSRQTIYNEFGTKQQLAEQLVMRELDIFLDLVREAFDTESEFVPAVREAVFQALTAARGNALLTALLETGHTGDSELLPYIFQSQDLIDRATEFLHDLVVKHSPELPLQGLQLSVALESVVRLVLSHLTQPVRTPADIADDLAWIVGAVVAGATQQPTQPGPVGDAS